MKTKERTLSKNEAKLILALEWQRKNTISLEGIRTALGIEEGYARFLAHQLIRKGWLERLRYGVFQLIPAERGPEAIGDTNPFLEENVFNYPCFYSFGSACSYYGFTDQVFSQMFLVSLKPHIPQEIRGKKYLFASVPQKRFFGFEKMSVLTRIVSMALPERALLDSLERPAYAGGIAELSRIISKAGGKIDFSRLVEFAKKWEQSALIQRLGVLLDLHQIEIPPSIRKELQKLVKPGNKIYLARRGQWKVKTRFNSEWLVVENVPKEILLEGTNGKRSFLFKRLPKKG